VTRKDRLEVFLRLPIGTKSLPERLLVTAAAPPMMASGTLPDSIAEAKIGELWIKRRSTSRPFCAKIPASFATHITEYPDVMVP